MLIWSRRNKDCALCQKKRKQAAGDIFFTKPKFAADCLMQLFEKKVKSQYLKICRKRSLIRMQTHQTGINRFVICNFPLPIDAKRIIASPAEMSFYDFLIRKEHKFLFYPDRLKISGNLKSLANYYSVYLKYRFYQMIVALEKMMQIKQQKTTFRTFLENFAKIAKLQRISLMRLIELK